MIVQLGNPVLREKARFLEINELNDTYVKVLIDTMQNTFHGVGVGLAAPQIGHSVQIAVIEDLEEYISRLPPEVREERDRHPVSFHVLINPKIIWMSEEKGLFFEGCLSISQGVRIVPRAKKIHVSFLNEKGEKQLVEAEGWYARILQHEIDHLNGRLFIDISDLKTEVSIEEYKNKWLYARASEIKKYYEEKMAL